MIASLRRRHRVVFAILAVLVPLLLALALGRRQAVLADSLPPGLSAVAPAAAAVAE